MLERFKVPDDIAVRVDQADIRRSVEDIFGAFGMPDEDAKAAADVLIYADLRGIDSHGVSNMMRAYVAGFRAEHINPTPKIRRTTDVGGAISIDCDNGLGLAQSAGFMNETIDRARSTGVAVMTAYKGQHYGPSAYYAHMALEHDMVGISMTAGGVLVAPTQGAQPMLGLNPIGIAAPSNSEAPFIFDASMSSVAGNKIQLLRRVGGDVVPGWVTDSEGAPIMQESPVPDGFMMLPLGGTREIGSHKGFGLSMMVEILCTVLAGTGGGPFRRDGVGHFFMALDIAKFCDVSQFKDDMDQYLRGLLECKPAPGETRVVYPGIPEAEAEQERKEQGIPYHPEVIDWFKTTLGELQLEHSLP